MERTPAGIRPIFSSTHQGPTNSQHQLLGRFLDGSAGVLRGFASSGSGVASGGGGIASLRIDPQGKAFAQQLLEIPIAVPRHLADQLN